MPIDIARLLIDNALMDEKLTGKRIRQARLMAELSQKEFAQSVGVDASTVWRWEKENRPPSSEVIAKIAEVLGTSVAYLLGETNNPKSQASEIEKEVHRIMKGIVEESGGLTISQTDLDAPYILGKYAEKPRYEPKEFHPITPEDERQNEFDKIAKKILNPHSEPIEGAKASPRHTRTRISENKDENSTDKLQASQDLDDLVRELASINPDLIVNFRTTKQHWKDLSPDTKKKIAQGMMFVLGLAELREEDGFRTPKSDEDL